MTSDRPALETITQIAVTSTGSANGWLLVVEGSELRVAAASGGTEPGTQVGQELPQDGTAGYVIASGQPVALQLQSSAGQPSRDASALLGESPTTVLCVPCSYGDAALGAIELVNKTSGEAFSFDDVEIAVMLGDVAGAVLAEGSVRQLPPSPEELAAELRSVAATDPARYAAVATAVEALLART